MQVLPKTRSDWCRLYFVGLETLALLTFGYIWLAEVLVQHRRRYHARLPVRYGFSWSGKGDPHQALSRVWVVSSMLLLFSCPAVFQDSEELGMAGSRQRRADVLIGGGDYYTLERWLLL